MTRFRGRIVFKAHRLLNHSTLGLRVIEKKKKDYRLGSRRTPLLLRALDPKPNALYPTLYTLHPSPYTLHPTPHTLHPTPHTLHPTPYTIHHTPFTTTSPSARLRKTCPLPRLGWSQAEPGVRRVLPAWLNFSQLGFSGTSPRSLDGRTGTSA